MPANDSILVVVAHPDDEVLGCGGTIARLTQEHDVQVVILGEGITSRYEQRGKAEKSTLAQLQRDAEGVAALLGIKSVTFGDLPDNRFDELPLLEVVKRVEQLVENHQPHIIYTHHPGDLNIDHLITFRAVLTATRPMPGCPVREIYACEIPSSTEWAFQQFHRPFQPNVFVDRTASMEQKIQALQEYQSEVRSFPHPRSPEALMAIARRWGSVIGVEYAEAFELIRSVR